MSSTSTPWMARSTDPDGDNMYDALRDLFLGEPEVPPRAPAHADRSPATSGVAPAAAVPVEALVLGHLPVSASAWVMQYARDIASQRGGPVTLIRARSGEVSVELVGGNAETPAAQVSTLDQAVEAAIGMSRGVIVRVDETSEPLLTECEDIDAITLLTGADEAAVVASYQTIKRLFRADDEADTPAIQLAIMGSSPERAAEVATKLERAAAAFLQRQVSVSACVSRIGAGRSALLFRGAFDGNVPALLHRVGVASATPTTAQSAPPKSDRVAPSPEAPPPRGSPETPTPHIVSRLGHVTPEVAIAPENRSSEPVEARPVEQAQAKSLAAHVAGLITTSITCPYEKSVQIALDGQGKLQLLAQSASASGNSAAVASLVKAAAWARSHNELLQQALKSKADSATLRLFTSSPADVRDLSEAGIRVHLLAQVTVEGKHGWFCTEIG